MDLQINDVEPLIMHIDLNSCYAIIEQQANRLIRNKPVGVAAYTSPRGFIIASSYEAKRQGIKLMRIQDAKAIDPSIIILAPDPEKYFDAHRRFKAVLERYTDLVTPKSIDEFIVDFQGSQAVSNGQSLVEVGYQMKADIKEALGEYVTVNIGIAPNRFLAKLAAGMDKPDGLTVIEAKDIPNVYGQLELLDLPGINYRYKARLNLAEIRELGRLRYRGQIDDEFYDSEKQELENRLVTLRGQFEDQEEYNKRHRRMLDKYFNFARYAKEDFEGDNDLKKKEVLSVVGQNLLFTNGKLVFEPIKYLIPIVEKYPALEAEYKRVETLPEQMKKEAVASIISAWCTSQDGKYEAYNH